MDALALILSTIALCIGVFNLLQANSVVNVKTKVEDKYSKYRNADGLYGGKKRDGT